MANIDEHFILHPHDGESPLEVRAISKADVKPKLFYPKDYSNSKEMQEAFYSYAMHLNQQGYNCYTVMNPIRPEFTASPGKGTTKDGVAHRTKVMVDLDRKCNEAKKHPATSDELSRAEDLINKISDYTVEMGWGRGESYININRTMINPDTGLWDEGPNYDGPSDKTVALVNFETLDGEPIAVYYNYAVHGVISGQLDEVSGDIPGASSRYIEESLGGDAVAVWSLGAAGDQNPIFFQQTYDLREIRINDYTSRGEDISNTMLPGGMGLDRDNPEVEKLMNQQRQMLDTMGQMLGEEVLHVMRAGLERPLTSAAISARQQSASCPGRRRTDSGREGFPGTYVPGEEVNFLLSVLRIGDVYLGGVNAEIFNLIAQRLKEESVHKHTMMVTLTNGTANSGYVPHDGAFGYNTFEVLSSRLQPGCAENAIVNGLLDLMAQVD
jgi:neutral ceramidase